MEELQRHHHPPDERAEIVEQSYCRDFDNTNYGLNNGRVAGGVDCYHLRYRDNSPSEYPTVAGNQDSWSPTRAIDRNFVGPQHPMRRSELDADDDSHALSIRREEGTFSRRTGGRLLACC